MDPTPATAPRYSGLALLGLLLCLVLPVTARAQVDLGLPGLSNQPATAGPGIPGQLATVRATANFEQVEPGQQVVLAVVLDIEPGYHAQSSEPIQDFLIPFQLSNISAGSATVDEPLYPEGHIENYPALVMPGDPGDLSVYTGRAITYVPLEVSPDAAPGSTVTVSGQATYQICDDQSCFPPTTVEWTMEIDVADEAVPATGDVAALFEGYSEREAAFFQSGAGAGATSDTDAAIEAIVGGDSTRWSVGWAFLMALSAGVIFNIMPCVLPVLPMKAWGFYEVANHNRLKSFTLGLVFAAGLVSVFFALAILILPMKLISWGSLFSNGWFVWSLVVLLVILGFGLFGAFTTGLPQSVYRFTPRHDTYSGNYAFGALAAVLATPCTAPLLPGVLLWAAVQPTIVGVFSVTLVGVGMSLPYVFLSLFPQLAKNFPRSGPWPELFKQMLGFMMLVAAAYFAGGRLLGAPAFWWVPMGVLLVACLFLIVRTAQLSQNALPVGISSTIAVVAIFAGIGGTPLADYFTIGSRGGGGGAGGAAADSGEFASFNDEVFEAAKASGRPVLVKFTANWCITCQAIERTVFTQPQVWDALAEKNVAVFKVDLTNSGVPGEDLLYELNPSGGIPLTAIWIPGREKPVVIGSLYTAGQLQQVLDLVPEAASASR